MLDDITDKSAEIAEEYVIGGALLEPRAAARLDLTTDHFSTGWGRILWAGVRELGEQADMTTLALYAESHNLLDDDLLDTIRYLARETPSAANIQFYADILRDARNVRHLRALAQRVREDVRRENWRTMADTIMAEILALDQRSQRFEYGLKESLRTAIDDIERARDSDGITGVPSGIPDVDGLLGGFHDSDLVIIGARPAMGKTAFLVRLAMAASATIPVGILSAEQPHSQLAQRMIAMQGRVEAACLRNPALIDNDAEWRRIANAVSQLSDRRIRLFDKSAPTIQEVQRIAYAWVHEHQIGALYVDYVQRIRTEARHRYTHEAIGEVVSGLKTIAKDLQIPVIALAQVNREVEKRNDKRPGMGDLKDSGSIEQEADQIGMLYRDGVYNPDANQNIAELNLEKNRHGPIGQVLLKWIPEFMLFEGVSAE